MPFFQLAIDASTGRPSAYGSAVGAILDGDFETGTGLALRPGITRATTLTALANNGNAYTVANDTFFWFGFHSSFGRTPTFMVAAPLPVTPDPITMHTVTFNSASMSGANLPAGWGDETYTFYGFRVQAGSPTITIT